jgi:hypothetical protein
MASTDISQNKCNYITTHCRKVNTDILNLYNETIKQHSLVLMLDAPYKEHGATQEETAIMSVTWNVSS